MLETLFLFWIFFFGAAIGSFLNVVVYRLPLGKSLSYPPSHCPACSHPIRWYDNVPVVGWLHLRGKCRDCKAPISVRYPIVEAVCGFVTTLFVFLLLEVVALLAVCLMLFYTLFAAGLIKYDGHAVPVKLFIPLVVTALLAFLFFISG